MSPSDLPLVAALLLVAVAATVSVLTRDPVRQAVVLAMLGLLLALLFLLLHAPDVALSQLAVGAAVTPLLILLTARSLRRSAGQRARSGGGAGVRGAGGDGGHGEGSGGDGSGGSDGAGRGTGGPGDAADPAVPADPAGPDRAPGEGGA
ncbi:hydrogenase subunit MbhD domain-containing protein [Streptomyces sp. NPDC048518]|uniref:hydrogenase subunit MbhD domain-containing protein n=1 Tax=Streptomyces sp. NPDC048518 TaxID=3155029 RepID=UPI0033DAB768